MTNNMELVATGARGIYLPQHVAEACELEPIRNTPVNAARLARDIYTLKEGPEAEGYWEAWQAVLDTACIRVGRAKWSLYQEGDCWAIRMNKAGRREAAQCFGWDEN